jgi:NUC153 domain
LEDDRFKEAFANPEFEIDEETVEYSQLNPTKSVVSVVNLADRYRLEQRPLIQTMRISSKGLLRQNQATRVNLKRMNPLNQLRNRSKHRRRNPDQSN